MKRFLTIEKGEYELNSSICVVLDEPLCFKFGENYLLTGDNGAGKSSFLSKLFIPRLLEAINEDIPVFYIPQDVTIQYYLIRYYYNGVLDEKHNFSSIEDALRVAKSKIQNYYKGQKCNMIFILDETDQYIPLKEFLKDLNTNESSILLITHNEQKLPDIHFRHLRFKMISSEKTHIKCSQGSYGDTRRETYNEPEA